MAVDGSPGTFWASKLDDTKGPIEFIIDFGEVQQLQFIEIDWEFPARGFAVSLSVDGDHFNEAFATDANILKHFRSGLGSKLARKLRITMYEVRVRQLCIWILPAAPRRCTRVYRTSAFELRLIGPWKRIHASVCARSLPGRGDIRILIIVFRALGQIVICCSPTQCAHSKSELCWLLS